MELQQILNSERLQQQHHIGQVGALDFWNGAGQQFVFVLPGSVQPIALTEQ